MMNRNNRFSGSGWKGDKKFGGRDSGKPAMMHKATCSECGNACEVPFKPNHDRPVFCHDCFKKGDNGNARRSDDRGNRNYGERNRDRDFGNRDFGLDSRPGMHKAVCDECGSPCEVPFRPSGDKPVFCSNCFKKGGASNNSSGNKNTEQLKEQLEILNIKLDRILKILTSAPANIAPVQVATSATKSAKEAKTTPKEPVVEQVVEKKSKTSKLKRPKVSTS